MQTPAHIVPEWYFWPFYAILRAFTFDFFFIPAKLMGVLAMFGGDPGVVLPALAGYLAGSFGPLPPAVPQVLLVRPDPDDGVLFYCGGAPAENPT
jgi:ubiquinol-cytochrome c reductase cytochrome b subunit